MDVQVITDISDPVVPVSSAPVSRPEVPAADIRRFTPDPATSPALLAALAWHTVGPRR